MPTRLILITALFASGILTTNIASGQNYQKLKRKGDAAKAAYNYKAALKYYDQIIDSVLQGKNKPKIPEQEWFKILDAAGEIVGGYNRYWNLAYALKGEKMPEKVTYLQKAGISVIFSIEVKILEDAAQPSHTRMCDPGNDHLLVWLANDSLFMQSFNNCVTYKAVAIDNKTAIALLKTSYDTIVKERPNKLFFGAGSSRTDYRYTLYNGQEIIKTGWLNYSYFTDDRGHYKIPPNADPRDGLIKQVELYHENLNMKLCSLFRQMLECEKLYKHLR